MTTFVNWILGHRGAVAACLSAARDLGGPAPVLAVSRSTYVVCKFSQCRQTELQLMLWPVALLHLPAAATGRGNSCMVLIVRLKAAADMVAKHWWTGWARGYLLQSSYYRMFLRSLQAFSESLYVRSHKNAKHAGSNEGSREEEYRGVSCQDEACGPPTLCAHYKRELRIPAATCGARGCCLTPARVKMWA